MRRLLLLSLAACAADDPVEPDAPPPDDLGVDIAAIPEGCVPGRSTADRPDDHRYDQIRVLYVTTSDGADNGHDTDDRICNSVRAMATWFHAASGKYLRFDTMGGLVDLGFVRLDVSDEAMRGNDPGNQTIDAGHAFVRERIERELQPLRANKLYAVYYEGTSLYACGGGAWPPLIVGRVGAMYLRAIPPGQTVPCGDSFPWGSPDLVPSYVDYGILHELIHSLGLVPDSSPNEHATGHVYDVAEATPNRDLMYSPRAGMPDAPWAIGDPAGLALDLGNDDYFMAPIGMDLSTSSLLAPLAEPSHRPIGW
jgi:hypothetical protein